MAVAKRSNGAAKVMEPNGPELSQEQKIAISRLREIAAEGLDGAGLEEGGHDIEPVAEPTGSASVGSETHAQLRIVEALLFASPKPLSEKQLAGHLPENADVSELIEKLKADYAERGIQLVKVAGKWAFRTADDLAYLLETYAVEQRRLSKAALETLAIIAYHQPVTRAEIEEVRGVQTSRGTLDVLMETNWVRPRGRRRAPGKPVTYGTTDEFLSHFGLEGLGDLPGLAELKGSGLLDSDLPPGFVVPDPKDIAALMPDELPLEEDELGEEEPNDEEVVGSDETDEVAIDLVAAVDKSSDASK